MYIRSNIITLRMGIVFSFRLVGSVMNTSSSCDTTDATTATKSMSLMSSISQRNERKREQCDYISKYINGGLLITYDCTVDEVLLSLEGPLVFLPISQVLIACTLLTTGFRKTHMTSCSK